MSKWRSSTFFWAASMRRETMPALDGLAFLHAEAGQHVRRPIRRRRCASGRLAATGRNATGAGIALPAGAAAQLVVDAAASRAVRCRRCAGRPSRRPCGLPPSSSPCVSMSSTVCFQTSFGHVEAAYGVLVLEAAAQASVSGLPPRMMSVPRPAMFVAMVTAPMRPAWATISASRADVLRLGVEQLVLDAAALEHARRA